MQSVCMCVLMQLVYISLCILVMLNAAQYVLFLVLYITKCALYFIKILFMFEMNFIKLNQAFVLFFTQIFFVQKQHVHHCALMVQTSCPGELRVWTLQSGISRWARARYLWMLKNSDTTLWTLLPKCFNKTSWMCFTNTTVWLELSNYSALH